MNRNLILAVESWVLIVVNIAFLVEISSVRGLEGMPLMLVSQTDCEDVLIPVRNGGRESRIRHGALVKLIAGPQNPIRCKTPVATDAGSESVLPFLGKARGRKQERVFADIQIE